MLARDRRIERGERPVTIREDSVPPSSAAGRLADLRHHDAGVRPAPEPQVDQWAHRYPVALVIVLALLAYSNSFTSAFVFDDIQHVRDNLRIRDLGALLSWNGYLPLRHRFVGYLTFALNYALGNLEVAEYHVVNFCIHAINCGLVYALVVLAFRTPRLRSSALAGSAQAIAFFAAALFATHPIQTQAVTYIVQRFTSLAALFYLLAVVLFLRWRLHREAGDASRTARVALYSGVLLSAVLGMKTKEIAFTLPIALILCEVSFFEPGAWRKRLFLLPIAATMLVIPLTYLGGLPVESAAGASANVAEATRVQSTISRLDYLLTQAPVLVTYLRLLVWPTGQNLDHDIRVAHRLVEARVLGSGLLLVTLAALAWSLYRRTASGRVTIEAGWRLVGFGVVWSFLALAVESSFVPIVDVINEHRVYLPAAGLFAGVATALALAMRRVHARSTARVVVVSAVIVSAVLAVASICRNRVWANDITLWSDAAQKSPNKARPHLNLGTALAVAGRLEEGTRELRRAVEIEPDFYSRTQLGAALLALGRFPEAEPELREAVRLKPADPEALFNLGMALMRTSRAEEAKAVLKRFLDVAPTSYAAARRVAERAQR
jgi:tetratricopeptide (TPR) repeat protein